MCGALGPVAMETPPPPRQPFSTTHPCMRPSGGQPMGIEEAKVTLVLGPSSVFPSSMVSRPLIIIGGLGIKSRKE